MKSPYYYSIYQKKYKFAVSKKDPVDSLNLTSLLDVLIILLFFLLMSYNPSEMELNAMNGITPPSSESLETGTLAVVTQINPELDVFVEKDKVGNLSRESDLDIISQKFEEAYKRQEAKFSLKKSAKQNVKNINFIIDGKVKYENMEKLMLLAAKNGFENYKFVVKSKTK